MSRNTSTGQPLWDLPTRLFHWLLALLFAAAWATAEWGSTQWHFYVGYSLLALLLFRIAWGLLGSRHSRFSDFVRGPGAILNYLRTGNSPTPGHNPLGGWSVIAMLTLLLAQVLTGLFNADDQGNEGPYHHLPSSSITDQIGEIHELLFDALLVIIALHLLAIAFYTLVRKMPLIKAMWLGRAPGKQGMESPRSLLRAGLIFLVSAGVVVLLVWLAPEQQTPAYF